jgi:hypothetical protein
MHLVNLLELNIEDKSGVGGDSTGEASGTVAVVRSDVESSLLAELHLDDTLIPALDNLANTNLNIEVTTADGAIELVALGTTVLLCEPASVLHGDLLAIGGRRTVALRNDLLCNTHCCLCEGKVARLNEKRVDSSGDASSSRNGCKRERAHDERGDRRGALYYRSEATSGKAR